MSGSSVPGSPVPSERARSAELLRVAEERRRQADGFAWTVPGLALASQAFLLTIALRDNTTPWAILLVALFGIVVLLAAAHFLVKQVHNFDLYETVIEVERIRLGYKGTSRETLLRDAALKEDLHDRPVAQQYVRRWVRGEEKNGTPRLARFVRLRAVWVWFGALGAIFVVDAMLLGYAIVALIR